MSNDDLTDFFAGLALNAMIQRNTGSARQRKNKASVNCKRKAKQARQRKNKASVDGKRYAYDRNSAGK